ncbi:DUF3888 domain-containing protein [Alicyclobacillus sp. TC]|nr:DUF3888 domain-containing protein [Alicyclobacillus sp. TC]
MYQTQIRSIKRLCNKGQFDFQTTVQVETWTGPKNPPFGLETIILTYEPIPTHPYVPGICIVEFMHQNEVEPILTNRHNCPPHH